MLILPSCARARNIPGQEHDTDYPQIVPACKAYTIKWTPTTPNAVSILLLRGPSENVVPLGAPLAEGIANSGSFSWTPSSSLEADTTHYGLQLIDDITGQYQYSTQFGISKDACEAVVSSVIPSSAVATTTDAGYGYPTETEVVETTSSAHGGYGAPSSVEVVSSTAIYTPVTSAAASTGYPVSNSTVLQPSKSLSVPESLKTTASGGLTPSSTGSAPPEFTGAASGIRAGLGLAGAVAGLVFML
jgi:hypothetical protein